MPAADRTCLATSGADQQMRCAACGLVWDMNDPEPPVCGRERAALARDGADAFAYAVSALPYKSGLPL
jgi:hypothetical protein